MLFKTFDIIQKPNINRIPIGSEIWDVGKAPAKTGME
jgi:hypothetical protein